MWGELSEFVQSVSTAITRHADQYVEDLAEVEHDGRLAAEDEQRFLDRFERNAVYILDRYLPPGPRRRESLVFAHLYRAIIEAPSDEPRRQLVAALLAAEIEFRGPLRLTRAQNERLARQFEEFGARFMAEGLP